MIRGGGQRGIGAVTLIVALLLVALLYVGYLRLQRTPSAPAQPATTAVDNTKAFACRSNRQTAEREVQMWLVNHPGETPTLEAVGSAAGSALASAARASSSRSRYSATCIREMTRRWT